MLDIPSRPVWLSWNSNEFSDSAEYWFHSFSVFLTSISSYSICLLWNSTWEEHIFIYIKTCFLFIFPQLFVTFDRWNIKPAVCRPPVGIWSASSCRASWAAASPPAHLNTFRCVRYIIGPSIFFYYDYFPPRLIPNSSFAFLVYKFMLGNRWILTYIFWGEIDTEPIRRHAGPYRRHQSVPGAVQRFPQNNRHPIDQTVHHKNFETNTQTQKYKVPLLFRLRLTPSSVHIRRKTKEKCLRTCWIKRGSSGGLEGGKNFLLRRANKR